MEANEIYHGNNKLSFAFKLKVLKIPKLEEWRSYLVNSSLIFYETVAHVSKDEIILINLKHTALNFFSFHDLKKGIIDIRVKLSEVLVLLLKSNLANLGFL